MACVAKGGSVGLVGVLLNAISESTPQTYSVDRSIFCQSQATRTHRMTLLRSRFRRTSCLQESSLITRHPWLLPWIRTPPSKHGRLSKLFSAPDVGSPRCQCDLYSADSREGTPWSLQQFRREQAGHLRQSRWRSEHPPEVRCECRWLPRRYVTPKYKLQAERSVVYRCRHHGWRVTPGCGNHRRAGAGDRLRSRRSCNSCTVRARRTVRASTARRGTLRCACAPMSCRDYPRQATSHCQWMPLPSTASRSRNAQRADDRAGGECNCH
jgi:hypothetical protein